MCSRCNYANSVKAAAAASITTNMRATYISVINLEKSRRHFHGACLQKMCVELKKDGKKIAKIVGKTSL
jgi:hypothetical protein